MDTPFEIGLNCYAQIFRIWHVFQYGIIDGVGKDMGFGDEVTSSHVTTTPVNFHTCIDQLT